jgi:hypothetical protein
MEEAGKCIASARETAAVFHLMRIMEVGVQKFGRKLGVGLTNEKVWQVILDEINKAIKNKQVKTSKQKARQAIYAECAAHLFNVKLAWRNPVMHPKASYTAEETEEIFNHAKSFMRHLAVNVL